ncbi:hypothetical protein ACMFMG_008722 [Clarireedia jacksonii]
MIRRPASGLNICLRCRIRLGQRPIPSIPYRTIRTSLATTDNTSSTQMNDDSSTQVNDDSSTQADDHLSIQNNGVPNPASRGNTVDVKGHFSERVQRHTSQSTHDIRSRTERWKRPLGRLLGGKKNGQWQASKVLNVKALGKTSEIIVLRDAKFTSFLPEQKTEEVEPPKNIDILKTLESERGIISDDELFSNFNEFRPTAEGNSLSWANLIDLVQVLDDSFTFSQMNKYLKSFSDRNKLLPSLAPDLINTNGIVRVSAWVPETSESSENLKESVLSGYLTPSFTAKQLLALNIIRQCWEVGVAEIEEGIGQAEVQLNPADLELLIKQGFLESISANYLFSELEKIEVFRKREVVRITSNREKAALIVLEIEDALRHITRILVPLRPIFPRSKDKGLEKRHSSELILRTIGQLTDTEIEKISSNNEPTANRDSLRIEYEINPENEHGSFTKQEVLRGLPWHQRMQRWYRWTVPIAKEAANNQTSEEPKQVSRVTGKTQNEAPRTSSDDSSPQSKISAQYRTLFGDPDDIPDVVSGSGQRSPTSKTDDAETSWDTEVAWSHANSIETSAVAGRVLHCFPTDNIFVPRELSSISKPEVLHTFSSDISTLFRALRDAPLLTPRPFETLVMRFKPNPWAEQTGGGRIGSEALAMFPLIEMRFSINHKYRHAQLRDVKAIKSSDTSDLMLPQSTFDLRFQHRVASHMIPIYGPRGSRVFSPSIESFVAKCNLDLDSDRPLETPASIKIPMADHICSPGARSLVDTQGQFKDHKQFPVDYLFAGLEYRNTMVFDFDGWETTYTTIEGGKAGGSGSELRLLPIRRDKKLAYEEDFMQSAYRMVDIVGSNAVLIARMTNKSKQITTGLSFTNIPRKDGRFKFWAYRPSDFRAKRTIAENDEEWQNKLKDELPMNEDRTRASKI